MESFGINWALLIGQLVNILLIGAIIILALIALRQLRQRQMPETARVLWVALIILAPLLGPLAFWLIRPGQPAPDQHASR
ncbi:MAG TPA: PLDc N-terminal domain-containing protein [Roseiflexaceae bacterium]|jgi:hypothetical protein|nr:PLDc N-terminal domain-containing protein [Roseiflexaceae bacterium]